VRIARCPLCGTLVTWIPRWDGKRIAVEANQKPEGEYFMDPVNGSLRLVYDELADDVPRWRSHNPCPKWAA